MMLMDESAFVTTDAERNIGEPLSNMLIP